MSLRVTFLGTAGAVPTTTRNTSAMFVRREGDRLLFDCGEGTQRQMMRFGTGFAVSHVFLSHVHGDHILGLPGLLHTWDFNEREAALGIYTPTGTRRTVANLLTATGTRPDFPVRITEVSPGDIAHRATEYEVRTFNVDHRTRAVGYALVEDERKGRFDRERAEDLGVPTGPLFSKLHGGESVELDDGTVVEPDQVVGPPRPGRRVVYSGDTRPADSTVEAATEADLLVHDATFADDRRERAAETGHSTATEAAEIAERSGVRVLALVHISSRYAGETAPLEREASQTFNGTVVVPDDGDSVDVPYPDES